MHPLRVALHEVTWHGAWLYGVDRTCAETAAASRGTSHVRTKQRCKYTTSVHVQKLPLKSYSHLFRIAPIRQERSECSRAGNSDIKASRILRNQSQNWHRHDTKHSHDTKQKYDTKTGMIKKHRLDAKHKYDTKPQAYSNSNSNNFNYPTRDNFVVVIADW